MKRIIVLISVFLSMLIILIFFFLSTILRIEEFYVPINSNLDDNLFLNINILQDDYKKEKEIYNLSLTISANNLSDKQKIIIQPLQIFDMAGKEVKILDSSVKYYSSELEDFFSMQPFVMDSGMYVVVSWDNICLPNSFVVNIHYTDAMHENQEYKVVYKRKRRIALNILTV